MVGEKNVKRKKYLRAITIKLRHQEMHFTIIFSIRTTLTFLAAKNKIEKTGIGCGFYNFETIGLRNELRRLEMADSLVKCMVLDSGICSG